MKQFREPYMLITQNTNNKQVKESNCYGHRIFAQADFLAVFFVSHRGKHALWIGTIFFIGYPENPIRIAHLGERKLCKIVNRE